MIAFNNISLRMGTKVLLESASATIHAGQRVALIGANGVGKSSLFRLVLGDIALDAGDLKMAGQMRLSHMAQEVSASERSALDFVLDGHEILRALESKLEQAKTTGDDMAIAACHAELDLIEAYNAPHQAEKLLHGLGFGASDVNKTMSSFSGGWRIRLNLARALMAPSDCLLLDEPTNHLDMDAICWLEEWLKRYDGTLIFVSHDRDFIDAVATDILHVEHQQLHAYTGNYSQFETLRSQRLALQQAQYEKQQKRRAEMQQFVDRFRAKATKAKQAQSRLKALAKMQDIGPAHVDSPFSFSFLSADKVSTPLLSIQEGTIGYPSKSLVTDLKLSFLPDMRVGLLGANGQGKSTLIKTLVGDLPLIEGLRVTGEHLKIGYFAQHQLEALDASASAVLHLQRLSPQATEQSIRDFLGGFEFRGDDAMSPVGDFSGGQKARLALAIIAWQKPNLLILDEPTNHLDIEMRLALTIALQSFNGGILMVSHDRHLLRHCVDTFWLIEAGQLHDYDGDLESYERNLAPSKRDRSLNDDDQRSDARSRKDAKRLAAEHRQQLSPFKKKLKAVEKLIEDKTLALEHIESELASTEIYEPSQKDRLQDLLAERADMQRTVEQAELDWLGLSEKIEALELARE